MPSFNYLQSSLVAALQAAEARSKGISTDEGPNLLQTLLEVREKVTTELMTGSELGAFLHGFFDLFADILSSRFALQNEDNEANKVRNAVLEILSKIPHGEQLKPYVSLLMNLLLEVLAYDNEENAIISIKAIYELHRSFRPALENFSLPLFKIIAKFYANVPTCVQTAFPLTDIVVPPPLPQSLPPITNTNAESVNETKVDSAESKMEVDGDSFSSSSASSSNYAPTTAPIQSQVMPTSAASSPIAREKPTILLKGSHSFRIIAECPQVMMLLIQCYPQGMQNVSSLLPPMFRALCTFPPTQIVSSLQQSRYKELHSAQVKTMTFVSHLLREPNRNSELFLQSEQELAKSLFLLLKRCPVDSVLSRKELLSATRQFLGTDLRKGLFIYAEEMLSERFLLGNFASESLRSLAYLTMFDLVQQGPRELNITIINKIAGIFGAVLNDSSLPVNVQVAAIRIFGILTERVSQFKALEDVTAGELILISNLRTLVSKLGSLRDKVKKLIADANTNVAIADPHSAESGEITVTFLQKLAYLEDNCIPLALDSSLPPVPSLSSSSSSSSSSSAPSSSSLSKSLFDLPSGDLQQANLKQLVLEIVRVTKGMLVTLFSQSAANKRQLGNYSGSSSSLPSLEMVTDDAEAKFHTLAFDNKTKLIRKLFSLSLECCCVFSPLKSVQASSSSLSSSSSTSTSNSSDEANTISESQDLQKVLEYFASNLLVLSPEVLRALIRSQISFIFDLAVENSTFLVILQQFIAHKGTSSITVDVLMAFFLSNVGTLSAAVEEGVPSRSQKICNNILRILKIALSSIGLFPENEGVLNAHLPEIVMCCLHYAHETQSTCHVLNLHNALKLIFRSLSNVKFDLAVHSLVPYIPKILASFDCLLRSTSDIGVKAVLLELCLTIPARMTTQLSYLPTIIEYAAHALRLGGSEELSRIALNTLEPWLENGNGTHLWDAMDAVPGLNKRFMEGINLHLRPVHLPGLSAFRLLGKFGGRRIVNIRHMTPDVPNSSRSFLGRYETDPEECVESKFSMSLRGPGGEELNFNLDDSILAACEILNCLRVSQSDTIANAKSNSNVPEGLAVYYDNGEAASLFTNEDSSMDVAGSEDVNRKLRSKFFFSEVWSTSVGADNGSSGEAEAKVAQEASYISSSTFILQKQTALKLIISFLSEILDFGTGEGDFNIPVKRLSEAKIPYLEHILNAVLMSSLEPELQSQAQVLLKGLCHCISTSFQASINYYPDSADDVSEDQSISVMNRTILNAMSDHRSFVFHGGKWLLHEWLATLSNTTKSSASSESAGDSLTKGPMAVDVTDAEPLSNMRLFPYRDLIQKAASVCVSCNWLEKLAGVKIIQEVCTVSPPCCTGLEKLIIESLILTLKDTNSDIVIASIDDIFLALKTALKLCDFGAGDNESIQKRNALILQCLMRYCFHSNPYVRLIAKYAFDVICAQCGKSVFDLIAPIKQQLNDFVTEQLAKIGSVTPNQLIGLCYGLIYALSIGIVVEKGNKIEEVFMIMLKLCSSQSCDDIPDPPRHESQLSKSFKFISDMKEENFESFSLRLTYAPMPVPTIVEQKLVALRLIRSIVSSTNGNSFCIVDERHLSEMATYCLSSIQTPTKWKEVLKQTRETLRLFARYPCDGNPSSGTLYLNEDMIFKSLQQVLSSLDEIRYFSVTSLQILESLVRSISSCSFYGRYGIKIVEFLHHYVSTERDKDTKSKAMQKTRADIAAAVISLCCFFPWREYGGSLLMPSPGQKSIFELIFAAVVLFETSEVFHPARSQHLSSPVHLTSGSPSSVNHLVNILDMMTTYSVEVTTVLYSLNFLSHGSNYDFIEKLLRHHNFSGKCEEIFMSDSSLDLLVENIFNPYLASPSEAISTSVYHSICILKLFCKRKPSLIGTKTRFASTLRRLWTRVNHEIASFSTQSLESKAKVLPESLNRLYHQGKVLAKLLIAFCRASASLPSTAEFEKPKSLGHEMHFDIIDIIGTSSSAVSFSFVSDFLQREVSILHTLESKKAIFQIFIKKFAEVSHNNEWKVKALQFLIAPMVRSIFINSPQQKELFFDANLLRLIMENVLVVSGGQAASGEYSLASSSAKAKDDEVASGGASAASPSKPSPSAELKIELFKLSSQLIEHLGTEILKPYKKELVKLPWSSIKDEDALTKAWAYTNMCYFSTAFEFPAKVIMQIYIALLRLSSSDGKDVIQLALDILVPVMQVRLPSEDLTKVIKWTRKLLIDEGNNMQQYIHVWSIVVRHAEIFFPYCTQIIPQMMTTLSRIGLLPNSTLDHRLVAVSMAEVLIGWEWLRRQKLRGHTQKEVASNPDTMTSKRLPESGDEKSTAENETSSKRLKVEDDHGVTSAVPSAVHSSTSTISSTTALPSTSSIIPLTTEFLSPQYVQHITNFIVRLGAAAVEGKELSMMRVYTRCLQLFKLIFLLFPHLHIKIPYFEKMVQNIKDELARSKAASSASSMSSSASFTSHADTLLITILQFLLSPSDSSLAAPSKTFQQNLNVISDLVPAIFESNNAKLWSLFKTVVVRTMTPVPDDLALGKKVYHDGTLRGMSREGTFMLKFKIALERGLRHTSDKSIPGNDALNSTLAAEKTSLIKSMQLIESLCKFQSKWIEVFASVLTKSCENLLIDHIIRASKALRADPANTLSEQGLGHHMFSMSFHPSPWASNLVDNLSGSSTFSTSSTTTATSSASNIKSASQTNEGTIQALVIILKRLLIGLDDGHLEQQRPAIVSFITSVIDSSNHFVLLNLVSEFCDRWLVGKNGAVLSTDITTTKSILTLQEQNMILEKICKNCARLSENSTQPHYLRFLGIMQRGMKLSLSPLVSPMLCIMCPVGKIRNECMERLVEGWGDSVLERLVGFFNSDVSQLSHRDILIVIPSLILKSTKVESISTGSIVANHNPSPSSTAKTNLASKIEDLSHSLFINSLKDVREGNRNSLSSTVSELGLYHAAMGESLWSQILKQIWGTLKEEEKQQLCSAVESFILNNCPKAYITWPNKAPGKPSSQNIVQSLLRDFYSLISQDKYRSHTAIPYQGQFSTICPFSIEFLTSAGTVFACWHEALNFLELYEGGGAAMGKDEGISKLSFNSSLRLLWDLDERDMIRAKLRSRFTRSRYNNLALSLDTYGLRHNEAQEVLLHALSTYGSSSSPPPSIADNDDDDQSGPEPELLEIWERLWIDASKELSNWNTLSDVATRLNIPDLIMETCSMQSEWDVVKRMRHSPSVVAQCENGALNLKLWDIMQAVVDNKPAETNSFCAQSVHMALFRWQRLPTPNPGSNAHKNVLHSFHRIIELRESATTMAETVKASRDVQKLYKPDYKNIQSVWRQRMPDLSQGQYAWDLLFRWRVFIYKTCRQLYNPANLGGNAHYHDGSRIPTQHDDLIWTMLNLAKASRKNNHHEVCLDLISKVEPLISPENTHDNFYMLREKVLCGLAQHQQGQTAISPHIMEIINHIQLNTNVGAGSTATDSTISPSTSTNAIATAPTINFDTFQQSELLRLQGLCNQKLGRTKEANASFSKAVQVCGTHAKSWLSWGQFCYTHHTLETSPQEDSKNNKAAAAALCILKAVEIDCQSARLLLGRVLWLAAFADSESHVISKAIQDNSSRFPSWVWLPYISDLLMLVRQRNLSKYFRSTIEKLADAYPNCIIYHLLSLKEKDDLEGKVVVGADGTSSASTASTTAPTSSTSSSSSESLTSASVNYYLEHIKKRPANAALLDRISRMRAHLSGAYTALKGWPARLLETLENLYYDMANCDLSLQLGKVLPERLSNGFKDAFQVYKSEIAMKPTLLQSQILFCKQFDEEWSSLLQRLSTSATALECMKFIQKWVDLLEDFLKDEVEGSGIVGEGSAAASTGRRRRRSPQGISLPSYVPPFTWPNELQEFDMDRSQNSMEILELPGQYEDSGNSREPRPDFHIKVFRLLPRVLVNDRELPRRLVVTFVGTDGIHYRYNLGKRTTTEQRLSKLDELVDWSLQCHLPARKRDFYCRHDNFVSVNGYKEGSICLTRGSSNDNKEFRSLASLCGNSRGQFLSIIAQSRELMEKANGDVSKFYQDACANLSETLLRDYFLRVCVSSARFYSARKHFASQLGMRAAKQLLINARALSPDQLLFSEDGEVIVAENVRPFYDIPENNGGAATGGPPSLGNASVPTTLRLTRSIWAALSPTLIQGILCTALGVVLDALEENKDIIDISLRFLFLYDIRDVQPEKESSYNFDQAHSLMARALAESAWQKSIIFYAPCHQSMHQRVVAAHESSSKTASASVVTATAATAAGASGNNSGSQPMEVETPSLVQASTTATPASVTVSASATADIHSRKNIRKTPIDNQILQLIANSSKGENIRLHNVCWLPQL